MGGAAAMQGVQMAGTGTGAGLQALARNKHGGGYDSAYGAATMYERLLGRAARDILGEERRSIEQALGAGAQIQPEVYRALGFEPEYADRSGEIAPLVSQRDALKAQLAAAEARSTLGQGKGKKPLAKGHSPNQSPEAKKRNKLRKQIAVLDSQISDLQTQPGIITGLRKLGPNDPTDSEGGAFREAFNEQNDALLAALRGEAPMDPTLLRKQQEEEAKTREGLRRQLGSDFESSTPGIRALEDMKKRHVEEQATYNRELIGQMSGLTENRATALSNLTGARIEQLNAPARAQASLAEALGGVATGITQQQALLQENRRRITAPGRDNRVMGAFGAALEAGFSQGGGGGMNNVGQ